METLLFYSDSPCFSWYVHIWSTTAQAQEVGSIKHICVCYKQAATGRLDSLKEPMSKLLTLRGHRSNWKTSHMDNQSNAECARKETSIFPTKEKVPEMGTSAEKSNKKS